jgi:hypothetical protein
MSQVTIKIQVPRTYQSLATQMGLLISQTNVWTAAAMPPPPGQNPPLLGQMQVAGLVYVPPFSVIASPGMIVVTMLFDVTPDFLTWFPTPDVQMAILSNMLVPTAGFLYRTKPLGQTVLLPP